MNKPWRRKCNYLKNIEKFLTSPVVRKHANQIKIALFLPTTVENKQIPKNIRILWTSEGIGKISTIPHFLVCKNVTYSLEHNLAMYNKISMPLIFNPTSENFILRHFK